LTGIEYIGKIRRKKELKHHFEIELLERLGVEGG